MFDKNEELIIVVDPEYLLESEQTQELNGLITTVVSAPYSKELESAFYIGSRDIDDNNIFWLYKVDKRTKENNNIILNGTYSLFDDLKAYDVIRDKRPSNASALVGINAILEGSRWQVGNITSTHTGTANWYYVSRLEAFWEYLENWNVEFKPRMTFSKGKITGRYIDIVDKLSEDYGKWYEYGDKLLQVTAEQASDSLYTAFIGRGKGEETGNGYGRRIGFEKVVWTTASGKPVNKPLNQDYVEIPSATELYGYSDGKPRMTVVIFEDTEDAAQVLQQTYDYALNECRPKLQLKANVLEDGVSELGETCTIIRDDRGIRYKTRVFKLTRNFLNKKQRTAEFGDEIVQSTAKRNSNTGKEIKKQEDRVIYWLDSLRQELVDSYFNEDGYNYDLTADNEYDLPAGYYSFDRPIDASPTKVIYMGAGKLMIANSKTPDGQWNWTTAADGDGANLDAVNTGVLQAGRIQSAVDGSFWDLDSGLFHLENGEIELIDTTGNLVRVDSNGVVTSSPSSRINTKLKNGLVEFGDDSAIPVGGISSAEVFNQDKYYDGVTIFTHYDKFFALNKQWTVGGQYEPVIRTAIQSKGLDVFVPTNIKGTLNMGGNEIHNTDRLYLGSTTQGIFRNAVENGTLMISAGGTRIATGTGLGSYETQLRINASAVTVSPDLIVNGFSQFDKTINMNGNQIHGVDRIYMNGTTNGLQASDGRPFLNGDTGVFLAHDGNKMLDIQNTLVRLYGQLDMNGHNIINQSDIRLKTNVIESDVNALDEINKMKFIEFDWDTSNAVNEGKPEERQFGIVAQYSPFLQTKAKDSESYLSIDITKQISLNSKAINELDLENKALKEELLANKQEIATIKQHLGLA